jgi:hypothetical protein
MSPTYFLVCNADSGAGLGIFRADNELAAVDAMLREAACDDAPAPELLVFPLVATITGRGPTSQVPDREDAVDFDVKAGDVTVGVTLLVDPFSGELDAWGAPDQWCADPKQARRDLGQDCEAAVVAVCRAAHKAG